MNNFSSDLLIIDCESSGLSEESYPISIGISGDNDQTWYWLVCPLEDWDYWDTFSEAIHGIERDQLVAQGRDAFLIAREMNAIFKGRILFSDSTWDQFWIKKLFEDSGVRMAFTIETISRHMSEPQINQYEQWVEVTTMSHHPVEDAKAIRHYLLSEPSL